jgi:glycosyltransferase involved in cell wall biosynthesis
MLIGIDASRTTVAQRTGTEGYSLHIIEGLIQQGVEHRFRLYFRDEPPATLFSARDNVEIRVIRQPRLWTHTGLRAAILREPPDVLFVPAHVIPWPGVGWVPAVVTAHDLGYLHYPEKHPVLERLYLDWSTRHSAQVARRVIAVSKATAHDLIALNGVPEGKIRVVYSGVDKLMKPVDNPEQIAAQRTRLGIPGPYVLHVGRVQARKNLDRLVNAFARIQASIEGLVLVLAGRGVWGHRALRRQIRRCGLEDRVILAGYVPDEDLPALYSGALVCAFPSLYEGFGFPALEAMACGTAVVCSNTSSLPELVEDAALSVAPTDTEALADALRRVLTDEQFRQTLVARGFERVKCFTWESSARATLDVLREAAGV